MVADLIPATSDKAGAVKVELCVAVSAATLMGLSEQPGELAGHGPIAAGPARVPFPLGSTSAANLGAF